MDDGRTNGWTERRDLESKKANYPARLLGCKREEVMRATKEQPPLHPLPIRSFLLCSDVSSL